MKVVAAVVSILITCQIYGKEGEEPKCKIGNFAVPPAQELAPLVSFGQNIIPRNVVQFFVFADDFIGDDQHFVDVAPTIVYGVTDEFSALLSVPFAASYKQDPFSSQGIEDTILQLEYAILAADYTCSYDQITIVANASFPTGSSTKNPTTGNGSMSYFVGTTYNRGWSDWDVFTSYGYEYLSQHKGTKVGNQYLYQAGVGRNIANVGGWLLAGMVEVNGTFTKKTKVLGVKDPNTGGNVIYLTPSFWASSKYWILQAGFGFVVQQNLFGTQNRNKYAAVGTITRTF